MQYDAISREPHGAPAAARRRRTHNSPMKLMTAQKMSEMMEMRSSVRFSCTVPLLVMYGISGFDTD